MARLCSLCAFCSFCSPEARPGAAGPLHGCGCEAREVQGCADSEHGYGCEMRLRSRRRGEFPFFALSPRLRDHKRTPHGCPVLAATAIARE